MYLLPDTHAHGRVQSLPKREMAEAAEVKSQLKSKRYERGSFIGKGQMGQCYELLDTDTQGQVVYAAKIVPQSQ